ncbi:MAG: hypothetical protein QOG64_1878 [Acidimicrobiaceae bacterium]|jgi:alkanesulfonate monooxygenase SsuD/methylene tetrahydromethanopterin reductase-like flavin-dependent oxidoreductase (luciferase family)|nr:hypothetical protein [Acidimicrobiaceae bacterium]
MAVEIGLALPQYDYSDPYGSRLGWASVREAAEAAEALGFASVWLADHLFLSVARYGGPDDNHDGFEPLVTLAALARCTSRVRLGTLVVCSQLRPAGVLAKQLAAVDVLSAGRVIAGMGAGWFEREFDAAGIAFGRPSVRFREMADAIETLRRVWGNEPGSPPCLPPPAQEHGPPIWIGGKGDRLLEVVAGHADGWNTVWAWTIEEYRERVAMLERACLRIGRDPASITRSVGLYTLVGEDERDARRRFDRLTSLSPPGVLADVKFEEWRTGRLVGSVDQVRDQLEEWGAEGVAHLVIGLGAVPFAMTTRDDLEMVASAARI